MSKARNLTKRTGRWQMAGIALVLGATISVSAGAQQTTPNSAGQRATPCPLPASGVTSTTSNGAISDSAKVAGAVGTTGGTTTTNGTPTGPATSAGVAASPTPNNTSTNPDKRFTGLNATNGGAGVGADTTTTGKKVPPVAEQIPSDSARTGATVCAPATGTGPGR